MENSSKETLDRIVLKISFKTFARATVSLPLFSLVFCFVSCMLFQFDAVNQTMCNVQNFIPSISAITGIQPQRYVWRVCIALHSTPRFALGYMYYNFYLNLQHKVSEDRRELYLKLVRLNFWLYTIENFCLIGVTYISNRENYPVHEKIFVAYMCCSLTYMLITCIIFNWSHPSPMNSWAADSYRKKKIYFTLIIICTAALVYFFARHRLLCEPWAFSLFALSEYGISMSNLSFHYTSATDFAGYEFVVGKPLLVSKANSSDAAPREHKD